MEAVQELAGKMAAVIINPIIALMFGAGVLVFVWGLVEYLYDLNIKGHAGDEGKKHMFWGLVGMFIMLAVFAIIRLIANLVNAKYLPSGF